MSIIPIDFSLMGKRLQPGTSYGTPEPLSAARFLFCATDFRAHDRHPTLKGRGAIEHLPPDDLSIGALRFFDRDQIHDLYFAETHFTMSSGATVRVYTRKPITMRTRPVCMRPPRLSDIIAALGYRSPKRLHLQLK